MENVQKIEICSYVIILFIMAIVLAAATLEPGNGKTIVLIVVSTILLLLLMFLSILITKSASKISWLPLVFGLNQSTNQTLTGGITIGDDENHKFQFLYNGRVVDFRWNGSLEVESASDEIVRPGW